MSGQEEKQDAHSQSQVRRAFAPEQRGENVVSFLVLPEGYARQGIRPEDTFDHSVLPGLRTALLGIGLFDSQCHWLTAGGWAAPNPTPLHGSVSSKNVDGTVGPGQSCSGASGTFAVIYYTWKDSKTKATTDTFQATWSATWAGQLSTARETFDITLESIAITLAPTPKSDQYLITDEPVMPVVQASAKFVGMSPDPTPATTFTWTAKLKIAEKGGSGSTDDYSSHFKQNQTTTGAGTFTLTYANDADTDLLGGSLTLSVEATVAGKTFTATTPSDLTIGGTNPERSAIQRYLSTQVSAHTFSGLGSSDVSDVIQRIACRESGQIQFKAAANGGGGPPDVAPDNGIGLMQITQASPDLFKTNPNVVFNWQTNARTGVTTYQTKAETSLSYQTQLKNDKDATDPESYQYWITNTVNAERKSMGLQPIKILPAPMFTTAGEIGQNPPDQLLEDAIRGYNGWGGVPRFDEAALHEFIPNKSFLINLPDSQLATLGSNPGVWIRVCSVPGKGVLGGPANSTSCTAARGSSGDPRYVNNVAANPTACPNGEQGN